MTEANITSLKTVNDINRQEALDCGKTIYDFIQNEDVVAFATILIYKDGTSRTMVTQYDDHLRMLGAITKLQTLVNKSDEED